MSAAEAINLAQRGVDAATIAEQCRMTVEHVQRIAEPIGRQRIKAMEASIRELMDCYDTAIQQQAVFFREMQRMQMQWDRLSTRIAGVMDRAEKLLPPPKVRGKKVVEQ